MLVVQRGLGPSESVIRAPYTLIYTRIYICILHYFVYVNYVYMYSIADNKRVIYSYI